MSAENPSTGQGPVVLDIGGDVGALVVAMPPATEGWEVEIRPAPGSHVRGSPDGHGPGPLRHVAVVPRRLNGSYRHSVVFAELVAGDYELYRRPSGPVELAVTICGGQVTQAVWPDSR